jgi:hypothetical protein
LANHAGVALRSNADVRRGVRLQSALTENKNSRHPSVTGITFNFYYGLG